MTPVDPVAKWNASSLFRLLRWHASIPVPFERALKLNLADRCRFSTTESSHPSHNYRKSDGQILSTVSASGIQRPKTRNKEDRYRKLFVSDPLRDFYLDFFELLDFEVVSSGVVFLLLPVIIVSSPTGLCERLGVL